MVDHKLIKSAHHRAELYGIEGKGSWVVDNKLPHGNKASDYGRASVCHDKGTQMLSPYGGSECDHGATP